ncbi:MAG TPA: 23S rRNA (adenine(2503)-C(2))-methyltransferase RlmN [bacterium]|nr:23S rRNA (adenine(2503)-C(2))-methyltransferase RlmN [bacterium]HOL48790.1 23S rRNA (adenine(2503)-C(2))-methyltransferase RlmN [bacterium]HPQ20026.1 23S rRNA (adenine(2503)-C(2))-methyltransferase RlmN [bacterium]
MSEKKDIYNYTLNELEVLFKTIGKEKYRSQQIFRWLYEKCVASFDEMTDINNELKNYLKENFFIGSLSLKKIFTSFDNTKKYLFETNDNHFIESVSIPDKDRLTLCISSQIGCAMKCAFCATGKIKFIRNLLQSEIIEQVIQIKRELKKENKNISNVVFMGMGEPFLNFENVIKVAEILHSEIGFKLANNRITISTSGIVPKILEFAKYKFKLAISLNSADDEIRSSIMPINKKYPLSELKNSIIQYFKRSNKNPVTFEYLLIEGVNSSDKEIKKLIKFIKTSGINAKVNLINYNSVNNTKFKKVTTERLFEIYKLLNNNKIRTIIRKSKGEDINAACGQLAGKYNL